MEGDSQMSADSNAGEENLSTATRPFSASRVGTRSVHCLKSHPDFFEAIRHGDKRHDLRRTDRPYAVGDIIRLEEFDPISQRYTGRRCDAVITYITSPDHPCALSKEALNPDFCILSIDVPQQKRERFASHNHRLVPDAWG